MLAALTEAEPEQVVKPEPEQLVQPEPEELVKPEPTGLVEAEPEGPVEPEKSAVSLPEVETEPQGEADQSQTAQAPEAPEARTATDDIATLGTPEATAVEASLPTPVPAPVPAPAPAPSLEPTPAEPPAPAPLPPLAPADAPGADGAVDELEDIAPTHGRLAKLRGRLSRSQTVFGRSLLGLLGAGTLDEDSWTEVEDTLLMADLGAGAAAEITEKLQAAVAAHGIADAAAARALLRSVLIEAVGPDMDRVGPGAAARRSSRRSCWSSA